MDSTWNSTTGTGTCTVDSPRLRELEGWQTAVCLSVIVRSRIFRQIFEIILFIHIWIKTGRKTSHVRDICRHDDMTVDRTEASKCDVVLYRHKQFVYLRQICVRMYKSIGKPSAAATVLALPRYLYHPFWELFRYSQIHAHIPLSTCTLSLKLETMCHPTSLFYKSRAPSLSKTLKQIWPLNILLGLFIVLCSPQALLVGGYTRWYMRLTVAFLLTRNHTLCKFLVIQGLLINMGWYSVAAYDFIVDGREFGNILYRNSPGFRTYTLLEGSWGDQDLQLVNAPWTNFLLAMCHVVDLAVHLLPLYYFMRCCKSYGYSMNETASWPILGGAYLLSRLYSISRCWVHLHKFGIYYYGYDVYWIPPDSDNTWTVGYVAEVMTLLSIAAWKIWKQRKQSSSLSSRRKEV